MNQRQQDSWLDCMKSFEKVIHVRHMLVQSTLMQKKKKKSDKMLDSNSLNVSLSDSIIKSYTLVDVPWAQQKFENHEFKERNL